MLNKARQHRPLRGLDLHSAASPLHYGPCFRCPIDHFGVILDKDEWYNLSERISASSTGYVLSPNVIKIDTVAEFGKFIIKDPSGNTLEFKYYSELIHPMSEAHA